jgi:hypothetical protein
VDLYRTRMITLASAVLLMVACGPAETQPFTSASNQSSPVPVAPGIPGTTPEPVAVISRVIIGSLLTVAANTSAQLPLAVVPSVYDATALEWSIGPANSSPPGLVSGNDTIGTVSATGVYTAPATPGTYRIFAIPKGWTGTPNPPAAYDYSEIVVTSTTPPVVSGTTYYVSITGNDGAAGTLAAPWRTIQHAANTMVAGDMTIVEDGTYNENMIQPARSGTQSSPIIFKARNKYGAIINRSTSACEPGFYINQSWIVMDGFKMTVSGFCGTLTSMDAGIRCWPGSVGTSTTSPNTGLAGCTIRNVYIGPNRTSGIKANQDYALVEDSESYSGLEAMSGQGIIFRRNIVWAGDGWNDSVTSKIGTRNFRAYDNLIYHTSSGGRGLVLGGNSTNVSSFWDQAAEVEAYNAVAYNNIVVMGGNANRAGIGMVSCNDCLVANNVVINGGIWSAGGGDPGQLRPVPKNPTWLNNIVDCGGGAWNDGWALGGTLNVDYNLFFNCSGSPSQAHPRSGDPLFVNRMSDWHLQAGSPAGGAGLAIGSWPKYSGPNANDTGTMSLATSRDGTTRVAPWNLGTY